MSDVSDNCAKPAVLPVFSEVRNRLDFPADEAKVLSFWKEHDIFSKALSAETRATGPSKGPFVFYEGPPTANGMPHNGHVLTRSIKDVVPRYKTMCGYDVPRKAGWDTHGLPVEVEVEKDLGIHGKEEIEAYGIRPFIKRCIDSVFRYTEAWENNTQKIGFWLDTKDAYVTYHKSYVQSVWWALSQLHKKGLLYRGHRVCWWWPQGGTALSAAEVGWNYKTVDDPSAYVALELADEADTFICVWTTTPWTLPSNGYAAVRSSLDYVKVQWGERYLIVAEALREGLAAKLDGEELPVVAKLSGSELVGRRYRPCFDTFASLYDQQVELKEGGQQAAYWRIIDADFVTLDAGTGIVHVAPAFGEDDNHAHKRQLQEYRDPLSVPLLCAVEPNGVMSEACGELAGKWVKEADPLIVADLRARGQLVLSERYRHEYPYCWRADDDPLIQLARPAWYIRTTDRIADAIENNQNIRWQPSHIRDGRFGDFLDNNVDWALSRERFWGTPLNVWVCAACQHETAPDSMADIERRNPHAFDHFYAAQKEDPELNEHLIVHKPWIDEVTFPCESCGAAMRRVPEVIDCWFDSGSMPFAQHGFPHKEGSIETFSKAWPADFISEAIDQTRGWFYSLLMVSTLTFDAKTCQKFGIAERPYPHPYKSCVVLGHVCDRTGKKESKSKGNYTPPDIIMERVRMEFAVIESAQTAAMPGKVKAPATKGVAFIAREDYEGLDLTGNSSKVSVYRQDGEPFEIELRAAKNLPRRLLVLSEEDRGRLGALVLEEPAIKPADVPRLAPEQRVFVEDQSRPAPGADAFRWFFYSASPPWTNTRHSLTNVRLAQKDFLIKLRNVFSFFTIYANIDGFNPAEDNGQAKGCSGKDLQASKGYRDVSERGQLDRWILSEVALVTRALRGYLDSFSIYEAAQRLVDLVDALSNWYVRRSRSRFWASQDDPAVAQGKRDAYFTLYETLVTLAKLIAPFVPFFAEELYGNLVLGPFGRDKQALSVHLCSFPEVNEAAIDEGLSERMGAIRELVSLGLQVRADNKLRVRQPLSRADVIVTSADDLAAYGPLLAEELNVHEIRWLKAGSEGEEIAYQLKPNFRALGPRLGKQVQAVKKALAEADAGSLRAELAAEGETSVTLADGRVLTLSSEEVQVAVVAKEGFAAAGGRAGVVVLHTELDQALLDEGLARDILAKIQSARKQMGLGFTERIGLTVYGAERVQAVVQAQQEHIAKEALCDSVAVEPLGDREATVVGGEEVAVVVERLG